MHVGARNVQLVEEHVGHRRVIVLPGVDDQALDASAAVAGSRDGAAYRRELHELRPGADDMHEAGRGRPLVFRLP